MILNDLDSTSNNLTFSLIDIMAPSITFSSNFEECNESDGNAALVSSNLETLVSLSFSADERDVKNPQILKDSKTLTPAPASLGFIVAEQPHTIKQ